MRRAIHSSLAVALIGLSGCDGGGGGYNDPAPAAAQPAAPTASISVPSTGTLNRTVQLTADATAGSGVNRVEFLVDGTVIANDTTAPYSIDWDTSTVADGSRRLGE